MFTELVAFIGVMFAFTLVFVVLIKLNAPQKFNPIKALNLSPGLYQNKVTGSLIEVKGFDGTNAVVRNNSRQFSMRYDILDREYVFVGLV